LARSPLSVSKFRYAFAGWWVVWGGLHAVLIMKFGFIPNIAILDSLVTNVQLLGDCWLVSNILKYYSPRKDQYWYIFILSLGLSSLTLLNTKWILGAVLSDRPDYLAFLSASWPVRFGISFLLIGCMIILSVLWYTVEEEQEDQKRKTDAERLSKEAELYKLRHQLQPHFLFNSLNSISALVGNQPEQARKMIQQLSDFLRGTLKREDHQWVSLSEELQNLELYLEIEKVRFGHRLSTVIDNDETCRNLKLPSMLLQPLVENAIKFGLYNTTEDVTILINAKKNENYLEIRVQNPFDAETSFPKQGTGFGLSSVQRRLYLLFARADLLETKTDQNLFVTTVKIPQILQTTEINH
jgi:two-component system LytT family sensor kinase